MPAYIICQLQVKDQSWVKEYGTKLQPLLKKYDGRTLVHAGKVELLEGTNPLPSVIIVLEFPTMEQARAWYHDPEYAPLIKLRQGGSEAEFVLGEGM